MSDSPSTRPARRWPLAAIALVALQAAAVFGYLLVEARRAPTPDEALSFERLDAPLPPLTLERPGARRTLDGEDGVVLLHLWATWCRPCREELPGLLALDGKLDVPVLAVSTDEGWPVIDHYFDGAPPPAVWRLRSDPGRLPMRTLPTTLVVAQGRIVARLEGARRWSPTGAERLLDAVSPRQ